MTLSRALLVLALMGLLTPLIAGSTARAAGPAPTISVSPKSVAPGDLIVVTLEGWPTGTVTASVCGNEGRRGSQDCDLRNAEGVAVSTTSPVVFGLRATAPPSTCPCVVQVATPSSNVVLTTPIELVGVEVGPVVGPAKAVAAPAAKVVVTAAVVTPAQDLPRSWSAPFAGSADRLVRVTITNHDTLPVTGLKVVAAIGRNRANAEPVGTRRIPALAPGERRTVSMPAVLEAPTWGTYVAFGSVYGLPTPLNFATKTSTEPWGLELAVPILLLVLAQLARRRERAQAGTALQESSPVVEDPYKRRSPAPAWIRADAGPQRERSERSRTPSDRPAALARTR